MRPVNFGESNGTLLGGPATKFEVGEVGDLPVFRDGRWVISCWQPTVRERLSVLFFGRVWLLVASRDTHHPVALSGARSTFGESGK